MSASGYGVGDSTSGPSLQERHLKVIVFSDVVDSSAQIFADELIAIQRIKEDLVMIRALLERHGGCLVKSLGDGILATFDGPTQALEFVEDVVIRISRRGHNSLQHRFGVHTGEIYVDGDDIIGQGVHLASRLQTTAPVNGVAFVQSTYDLIDPRFQHRAVLVGPVTLKGVPGPITCYAIEEEALLGTQPGSDLEEIGLEDFLADTPYRLVRPLGDSSRSNTNLVRQVSGDRKAVLKLIPCDATNREAIKVEAACMDRLRHPRLPRFVDGFEHQGFFLFLQEYIAGASLQGSLAYLRRKQKLAELLRQVLEVLEAVHTAGIVHGDIHPANLIPSEEGGPVFLVDFGLLKAGAAGGLQPTCRPFYSPPERARFGSLSVAGDLYALGVLALALYTGKSPADLYDQAQGRWRLDDLDPEVIDWLAPLLEESPALRLQSAADALQRLDRPRPLPTADAAEMVRPIPILKPLASPVVPLRKSVLLHSLAETYGPVVELLLESCLSTIPIGEVESLRLRLVGAGLALPDVDQAFRTAMVIPQAPSGQDPGLSAAADSDPRNRPNEPHGLHPGSESLGQGDLLDALRHSIGPIADLIWSEPLRLALSTDPPAARRLLLQSAVPEALADEFLALARSRGAAAASIVPSAPALAERPEPTDTSGEDPKDGAVAPGMAKLREVVLGVVGPIGGTLLDSLEDLPPEQSLEAVISSLRKYGVDPDTLNEVRLRLGQG
ncbi:protein kinase [Synechococcus sp. 1G10]|uniref:protein kinase domain-containing protein n=1 Tax=Synechococcus sp. 1G10 TaxID=2025605 RepID=UPI000B98DDE3|nr:protein kinase [Synechococcus sp. 1G10]